MLEDNEYKDLFEEKEIPKSKKANSFFAKTKKSGKIVFINKSKNKIIVDLEGQGIEVEFIPEKHSALKAGDSIEIVE